MANMLSVIKKMVSQRWISLKQMHVLLGYNSSVSVYQLQKTNNPIPFVLVGGIKRVTEQDAIKYITIRAENIKDNSHILNVLEFYKTIKSRGNNS